VANALLIVAALHAGAALVHQFIIRDTVMSRMLPERRSAPKGQVNSTAQLRQ
jgi:cytochrome b561